MWKPQEHFDRLSAAQSRPKQDAKERILTFVVIAIWVATCFSAHAIYESIKHGADNQGWIEHSYDTPVWIGGDWLTGEYRVCKMPLLPTKSLPTSAHLLCGQGNKEPVDEWPVEFIEDISNHDLHELMGATWSPSLEQRFHVLPVRYWGRIDRTGQLMFSWRCQRQASGLVCDAVN
jgi:hypothetical protein